MTLKHLRILIVISWLIYLCAIFVYKFYDPSLYSPIIHIAKIQLEKIIHQNLLLYFILVADAMLIIYASAALWFGHITGKWAYTLYIAFALIANYFLPVQAFSSLDIFLEDLNFLILGIILLALYTSPLKEILAVPKLFPFWKIAIMFFIFFMLFFALPISFYYLSL